MTAPVTIITGASSGIGAATAYLLAQRGHRLALVARDEVALQRVADAFPGDSTPLVLACDVTSREHVERAVNAVVAQLGTPFGLVNAAGVCVPRALAEIIASDWDTTIAVNLTGTFLMCQAVASHMRAGAEPASIVNLGSEAASVGMPHYAAYCASKAGVLGLTRALAAELAPRVRVNALCPGPVDTPMLHQEFALTGDLDRARVAEVDRIPLRAIATAEQVADAVAWLLCAQNATGTSLALDGGTTVAFYGAARQP
jgi:NAD(P)-dependent dehydrogenase (short-subunit alcohol dehydrogenase family)